MKKTILTFAQLLFTAVLFAQTIPDFKSAFGINENIITTAETDNSYWLGTDNGVYQIKKKSHNVYQYTSKNSALPSNHVTCICTKPDGQVYIGTSKGIMRYDLFAFIVINTENSDLLSDDIKSLTYDPESGIIVKTNNDGFAMVN